MQQCLTSTIQGGNPPLATWAFAPHYMWKDVFRYFWSEVDGWWCLFAEYADHLFMPLPPLGPNPGEGSPSSGSLQEVLSQVITFMDTRNTNSQFTKIENIPEALKEVIQPWGYSLTPNNSDYLYRTEDLVQLKASAYKSQRAAYNRFCRTHRSRVVPYSIIDRDGCLALFHRWAHQKEETSTSHDEPHAEIARLKVREAASAHRVVLQEYRELGLTGRVVWVDGSIKAYAFGYPRSQDVFCVLLEVADRSVHGLAPYLFREFCREFQQYACINTMDDSGLPSVIRAKRAYHPCQLVANYRAQPSSGLSTRNL